MYYLIGVLVLAMGLTLNTKTDLGTSAIISIPYTFSFLCGLSFANLTLIFYIILVGLEFVLKGEQRRWTDILQIPFSIVFTRFLSLFSGWFDLSGSSMAVRLAVLAIAIICTGVGAALTVDMDLIANPGDGFVQAVAICIKKDLGTAKNIVDLISVAISLTIGFLTRGKLLGVGLGTVIAMIFVGRVIALFNYLFKKKLSELTV